MDCVQRVAREELGARVTRAELVAAFDDITGDPRGHVVDLVYRCELLSETPAPVGDTAEIRFFKNLPAKIGFNHRGTLVKLGYR